MSARKHTVAELPPMRTRGEGILARRRKDAKKSLAHRRKDTEKINNGRIFSNRADSRGSYYKGMGRGGVANRACPDAKARRKTGVRMAERGGRFLFWTFMWGFQRFKSSNDAVFALRTAVRRYAPTQLSGSESVRRHDCAHASDRTSACSRTVWAARSCLSGG
jgi:hypothetical protein